MKLLDQLNLRTKLLVILALPLLGLLYFAANGLAEKWQIVNESSRAQALTGLSINVAALVDELQKERGMSAGFLGSQGVKFADQLADQRRSLDTRVQQLAALLKSPADHPGAQIMSSVSLAQQDLQGLSNIRQRIDTQRIAVAEQLQYYSGIVAGLLDAIAHISTVSANAQYSNNVIAYHSLLLAKEYAGVERAFLANVFSLGHFKPGMYGRFVALNSFQQSHIGNFKELAAEPLVEAYDQIMGGPVIAEVERLRMIASRAETRATLVQTLAREAG